MKEIKLLLILLIGISFSSNLCSAQTITKDDKYIYIEDRYMPIYENIGDNNNGDYSRGAHIINAKLIKRVAKNNPNDTKLFLNIIQTSVNKRTLLVSKLGLKFTDGSSTSLLPIFQKRYIAKVKSDELSFDVTEYERKINSISISKLLLSDYEKTYNLNPTDKYLLRRQLDIINTID